MEKLNPQQIARLYDQLSLTGASNAQIRAHFGQFAAEVEHFMWIGLPFESALDKVMLEAGVGALPGLSGVAQSERALTDAQLQEASLDDIVFQFRNKAYGAYDLRQNYNRTLRNAFIMALGLCLMGISLLQMVSQGKWSYLSMWGGIWLLGIGAVTYSSFSLYVQREHEKELSRR